MRPFKVKIFKRNFQQASRSELVFSSFRNSSQILKVALFNVGLFNFFAALRSFLRILLSNLASEPLPNSSSVTLLSLKGFETGRVTLSCFDDARMNKYFPVLNL